MFTRTVLSIFTWAFVLELFVLIYYLPKETKPFEFYLDLVLTIFTAVVLIFVIIKEKRKKELENELTEDKKNEKSQ
ncbi:hypothetical protein SAMN04488510_10739 [Fervidobacterium changbaicum]|uniref:Group-specific protein n=1 Tax=Fervidobacterium changbaicum TaxID=310769 RepID=A0ABX5QQ63_9BACT|nr:hypothetical protein [Fervidobacterium changbaicum]QAV32413.1 hypothetical protein CBS1_00755 [Fervidobacterium changbaicum]SDH18666.1 hypothetical protein SAMN04488510_10739 [Fervidobacterium changbaicum]